MIDNDTELSTLIDFEGELEEATQKSLQDIFSLLQSQTGHDFSLYKSNTLCRRIERRMNTYKMSNISIYVHYLERNPEEIKTLSKELLIGVTNFFRDRKAYDVLHKQILPKAVEKKVEQSCFRVWVPACSTGEEAYSIAILLQECIDTSGKKMSFQIFASDIDDSAIKIARTGQYKKNIEKDINAKRLKRFFIKTNEHYRIKQELRDCIIFATQSVIKDPPFTRIDFLSCRNLLIYLGSKLQKKLLPLFHYSLNPSGILFLGASESTGSSSDYFEAIDKKHKTYCRKDFEPFNQGKMKFPITQNINPDFTKEDLSLKRLSMNKLNTNNHLDKLLIENCIPSCIVTDENGDIVYVHGHTGIYVEPASGTASLNITDMAKPGLETKISYAIRELNAGKKSLTYHNLRITDHSDCYLNLVVKSVTERQTQRKLIVFLFEEIKNPNNKSNNVNPSNRSKENDPRIPELERELKYTKEHLQSTIEELKSTNEELQSTNEELQSTNEELETSKEELVTVNAELENRIEELSNTNDDIKNLLDSTSIATIFLDDQRHIKRFTPKTMEIIRLIPADIGRTVDDIAHNLKDEQFIENIKKSVSTNTPIEKEVQNRNLCWYYMRITPYKTISGTLDGVVLTFEDITEIKKHRERLEHLVLERTAQIQASNQKLKEEIEKKERTETALRRSETRFHRLFELDIMGIFFTDKQQRIVDMNSSFSKMITYSKADLPLAMDKLTTPALEETKKDIITAHEKTYLDKNKNSVYVMQSSISLEETDLDRVFFVMDTTPSKKVEKQLRRHQTEYAHITRINSMGELASGIAHEINQPLTNITNYIHGLELRMKNKNDTLNKNELFNVMHQIAEEAERSSSIIKKMRDLTEKKKINPSPIDVKTLIEKVLHSYESTFKKNDITAELTLSGALPQIRVDKIQLEQVLINLLNNAIEALQHESQISRHIRIEAQLVDDTIEICVENKGALLPTEQAEKIFDMFYTTKKDGIGMGLGISRSIIESYGGYLHCLPQKGRGNIFKVSLPIEEQGEYP